jgi:hypothetical protein
MYTDRGESLFAGAKPIIINGISSLIERSDLGSRTILIELPSRKSWISDRVFWKQFEAARPRILGALLTLVSTAIRHLPDAKSETTQRSADLEAWCDAAIEPAGSFAVASLANRLRVRDDYGGRCGPACATGISAPERSLQWQCHATPGGPQFVREGEVRGLAEVSSRTGEMVA